MSSLERIGDALYGRTCTVLAEPHSRFVSQADEMRPHPSQGEGLVQIVVEPKQELPFENCTAETTGGAAKRGGGPNHAGYPLSSARLCNRAPPRESTLH